MAHTLEHELQKRLRFIEGQARGVQGMVKEGRDLADVLTQLLAIQSASRAAAQLIIQDRMVQRIKESVNRAVLNCVGECEFCDELEGLTQALEEINYSTVLEELAKLH